MKTNSRRILTSLTALSMALSQLPAFHVNAASEPRQEPAAAAEPAPVSAEADTAAPAVTTGPAEAYAANTGTCTTAPKMPAPPVSTTATEEYWEYNEYNGTDFCCTSSYVSGGYGDIIFEKIPKTVYQIGEKFDLDGIGNIIFSGEGFYDAEDGCCTSVRWDVTNQKLSDYNYTVDTDSFDSSKPGKYWIQIRSRISDENGTLPAYGAFQVEVVAGTGVSGSQTTTTVTTCETDYEYDPYETSRVTYWVDGTGDISFDTIPKQTYQIGEELDLSGIIISGWGEYSFMFDSGIFYTRVPWSINKQKLENFNYTVDDSCFDNTKAGTYPIYITMDVSDEYGSLTAKGSFDVKVVASTKGSGSQTTTTVTTCTTEDPWEAIRREGTNHNHDLEAWWMYDSGKAFYYDGAPKNGDYRRYCTVGDEIAIELPYSSKDHKPMYDTAAWVSLSNGYVDTGYFTFTDTAIIWHSKALKPTAGEGTVVYLNTKSETGIGWEGSFKYTISIQKAPVSTETTPWKDGYFYCGNTSFTSKLNFSEQRETVTIPYPDFCDPNVEYQPENRYYYNVELTDADGNVINDKVLFTRDCIIIPDISKLEKNTSDTSVQITVSTKDQPGSYKADYIINSDVFISELWVVYPGKEIYQIGEKLDLSEYAIGGTVRSINTDPDLDPDMMGEELYWDCIYGKPLLDCADYIDTSEFDNTKVGKYTITVYKTICDEKLKCSFTVEVVDTEKFVKNTGDINQDGILDVRDGVLLARIVGGDTTFQTTEAVRKQADVNGDTTTNALDLTLLLRKLARLI